MLIIIPRRLICQCLRPKNQARLRLHLVSELIDSFPPRKCFTKNNPPQRPYKKQAFGMKVGTVILRTSEERAESAQAGQAN